MLTKTDAIKYHCKGNYFWPKWRDWNGLPEYKIRIKQGANGRSYNALAGFNRNGEMADYADALIAVWDGKSSGTAHMIDTMHRLNKPVCVLETESGDFKQ